MKKILITGSTGFVGKALIALLEKEHEYKILETGNSKTIDLTNWENVKKLPHVDIIIHLAAKSFIPDSFKNPAQFYQNNILSTLNILEKAKIDASKVIFLSTYVYGSPQYLPIDESHPKQPLNPYTQSKILCEELCEAYSRDFNVSVIIFRPFNIYGLGQSKHFFIPTIINQLNNDSIELTDPRPKRDFIYIDDVIEAIRLAINHFKYPFSLYNLGSGISTSIQEVVAIITKISQTETKVNYSNQIRQGEVLDTVADIQKIKKELQWTPKYSIEMGLDRILNT